MKALLLISILFTGAVIALNYNPAKPGLTILITRNTSEQEMAGIIKGANELHMKIKIEEAVYDEKGNLSRVQGEVEFPNGSKGTFTSNKVGKIILTQNIDGTTSIKVRRRLI